MNTAAPTTTTPMTNSTVRNNTNHSHISFNNENRNHNAHTTTTTTSTTTLTSTHPNSSNTTPQPLALSSADIFHYAKYEPTNKIPILNENFPLSMFVHADTRLIKYIEKIRQIKSHTSYSFNKTLEKLHEAQKLVLNCIFMLHLELDHDQRASREYRSVLPEHDRMELENGYSENILFAAKALTRGFRIRGLENRTSELIQPAQILCATFDAIRFTLRQRADQISIYPPYNDVQYILIDFDKAWTTFESTICSYYFMNHDHQPSFFEQKQILQILLNETVQYATSQALTNTDQVESADPSLIFGIPRLAVLYGLRHFTEFLIAEDQTQQNFFFTDSLLELRKLKEQYDHLNESQVSVLEKWLLEGQIENDFLHVDRDVDNLDNSKEFDNGAIVEIYKNICDVADRLQSGPKAKYFVDVLGKAFRMQMDE